MKFPLEEVLIAIVIDVKELLLDPYYIPVDVPVVDDLVALGQRVRQDESIGRAARRRGRARLSLPVGLLLVQYHFLRLACQLEAHL